MKYEVNQTINWNSQWMMENNKGEGGVLNKFD
jgi:hypothetical protein